MRTVVPILGAVLLSVGTLRAPRDTSPWVPVSVARKSAAPVEPCDRITGPTLSGTARRVRPTHKPAPWAGPPKGSEFEGRTIRLVVRTRHVLTGADVHARWNVARPTPTRDGPAECASLGELAATERAEEERQRRDAEEEQRWRSAFVPMGEPLDVDGSTAEYGIVRLAFELPRGIVLLHGPSQAYVLFQRVSSVPQHELIVPVVPEALLEVRVTSPDGSSCKDARICCVHLGARHEDCEHVVEEVEPGVMRLHGLPELPGERVDVIVEAPICRDARDHLLRVREWVARAHTTYIPAGSCPWHLTARIDEGEPWPFEDGADEDEAAPAPKAETDARPHGSLRLRLLDPYGHPLRGAEVLPFEDVKSDAKGMLLLERVPAGPLRVRARAPGHLRLEGDVDVIADATVDLVLREPRGARLELSVQGADGRPLPGARFVCRGTRWFDIHDGVQRLDATTDEDGRRVLPRIQPGTFRVMAFWGGRYVAQDVTTRDSETTKVTLVAR